MLGEFSIPFAETDYDPASYDGGDGLYNAEELAAGTSPVDMGCVIGV